MKALTPIYLILMIACQAPESTGLSDEDNTAVMIATEQYASSIIEGDFDKMRSLMDDEMTLMPPNELSAEGIEASLQVMQNSPSIDGSINPDRIEGDGNLAFVRGTFDLTLIVNDSTQTPNQGKYIEVWKKQIDGSWKIVVDIWNSDKTSEM